MMQWPCRPQGFGVHAMSTSAAQGEYEVAQLGRANSFLATCLLLHPNAFYSKALGISK